MLHPDESKRSFSRSSHFENIEIHTWQEQAQLAAIHEQQNAEKIKERDFEGGFGGQEDLEDRYATTSGEH